MFSFYDRIIGYVDKEEKKSLFLTVGTKSRKSRKVAEGMVYCIKKPALSPRVFGTQLG